MTESSSVCCYYPCAHAQAGLSNRCCLSTVSQSVSLSVCRSLFEARFSGTYFAVQAMKMATYSQSLAYWDTNAVC